MVTAALDAPLTTLQLGVFVLVSQVCVVCVCGLGGGKTARGHSGGWIFCASFTVRIAVGGFRLFFFSRRTRRARVQVVPVLRTNRRARYGVYGAPQITYPWVRIFCLMSVRDLIGRWGIQWLQWEPRMG